MSEPLETEHELARDVYQPPPKVCYWCEIEDRFIYDGDGWFKCRECGVAIEAEKWGPEREEPADLQNERPWSWPDQLGRDSDDADRWPI